MPILRLELHYFNYAILIEYMLMKTTAQSRLPETNVLQNSSIWPAHYHVREKFICRVRQNC